MLDNPKVNPEPQSNTVKNPEDWVSGDENDGRSGVLPEDALPHSPPSAANWLARFTPFFRANPGTR
jgi:hypothetical protein